MALKMLVTLDGSPFSEGILDVAQRAADLADADVYLLRVVAVAHDRGLAGQNFDPRSESEHLALRGSADARPRVRELETSTQAAQRLEDEARDYLKPLAARFGGRPVEIVVRHGRHPADEILRTAEELGVDLIAMATHGRTGIRHALAGSVAEAVVRAGKTPVLLIRPRG